MRLITNPRWSVRPPSPLEVDWSSSAWRQHPQARGLYAWWPTLAGVGGGLREMVRGADATPYSGASIIASPQMGLSTDDFVGNSDPDRRWDSAIPWAGGPITLSMWVFAPSLPPAATNTQAVGFRDVTGNSVPYIGLNVPYNDGSIYWYCGPSWSYELTASYTAHIGKWTHVVLDSDATSGGLNRIWINGQLVATRSSHSGSPGVADTISIGGTASRSHWGRLADVRLYNRTLSAAEAWELYAPQSRWQLMPARPTRRWFFFASPPPPDIDEPVWLGRVKLQRQVGVEDGLIKRLPVDPGLKFWINPQFSRSPNQIENLANRSFPDTTWRASGDDPEGRFITFSGGPGLSIPRATVSSSLIYTCVVHIKLRFTTLAEQVLTKLENAGPYQDTTWRISLTGDDKIAVRMGKYLYSPDYVDLESTSTINADEWVTITIANQFSRQDGLDYYSKGKLLGYFLSPLLGLVIAAAGGLIFTAGVVADHYPWVYLVVFALATGAIAITGVYLVVKQRQVVKARVEAGDYQWAMDKLVAAIDTATKSSTDKGASVLRAVRAEAQGEDENDFKDMVSESKRRQRIKKESPLVEVVK